MRSATAACPLSPDREFIRRNREFAALRASVPCPPNFNVQPAARCVNRHGLQSLALRQIGSTDLAMTGAWRACHTDAKTTGALAFGSRPIICRKPIPIVVKAVATKNDLIPGAGQNCRRTLGSDGFFSFSVRSHIMSEFCRNSRPASQDIDLYRSNSALKLGENTLALMVSLPRAI
jgi:hypothetical protein